MACADTRHRLEALKTHPCCEDLALQDNWSVRRSSQEGQILKKCLTVGCAAVYGES